MDERLSLRALSKLLTQQDIATPRGGAQWQPTEVESILRNPVYKGTFYYQRNESVEPQHRPTTGQYYRRRKTALKPRSLSL